MKGTKDDEIQCDIDECFFVPLKRYSDEIFKACAGTLIAIYSLQSFVFFCSAYYVVEYVFNRCAGLSERKSVIQIINIMRFYYVPYRRHYYRYESLRQNFHRHPGLSSLSVFGLKSVFGSVIFYSRLSGFELIFMQSLIMYYIR